MRKSIPILAATLAAILASGATMANEDKPAKKAAAEAPSAQPVDDTWITTKVKSSLLADTA
ncbi:MAG: transporter, partial [Pseudoxanthomonas sp.]|nr:transporter [Pseudoxanthomonas sp.]